jgi:hypothetical protein
MVRVLSIEKAGRENNISRHYDLRRSQPVVTSPIGVRQTAAHLGALRTSYRVEHALVGGGPVPLVEGRRLLSARAW